MKKHTKRGIKKVWDQSAQARAQRKKSSAPTEEELDVYEKCLIRAVKGIKRPRVLIMGATPELRELALKHDCETVAVDISLPIISAMTTKENMAHALDEKDIAMRCDWLAQHYYLEAGSFDAVMGDVVLNNIPADSHYAMLRNLNIVLRKGGCFITRHVVYHPNQKHTFKEIQRLYDEKKIDWMDIVIFLGYYSPADIYNYEAKQFKFSEVAEMFNKLIKNKKIKLRRADKKIIDFVIQRQGINQLIHITFSKAEFEKMASKYFKVLPVEQHRFTDHSHSFYAPIYCMEAK